MASPSVIPGILDKQNVGAIDWRGGMIAYGVQFLVAIVEPETMQLVQTLDGHLARVCEVRWAPRAPLRSSLVEEAAPLIASADTAGICIVWDVARGERLVSLASDSARPSPIVRMQWLDNSPGTLLCAHNPTVLMMWQVSLTPKQQPSTRDAKAEAAPRAALLWRVELPDAAVAFAFDPVHAGRMGVLSSKHSLMQLTGLSPLAGPTPESATNYDLSPLLEAAAGGGSTGGGTGISGGGGGGSGMPSCTQIAYSPHEALQMYVMAPRALHVWDLRVGQACNPMCGSLQPHVSEPAALHAQCAHRSGLQPYVSTRFWRVAS